MDQGNRQLSPYVRPIPEYLAESHSYYQDIAAEAGESHSATKSVKEYVQFVIKYRWLIIPVWVAIFAVFALYSFLATPLYRATATVRIGTYAPIIRGAGVEDMIARKTTETNYLNTQVEALSGLTLADRVFAAPGMRGSLEQYLLKKTGLLDPIRGLFSGFSSDKKQTVKDGVYQTPLKRLRKYLKLVSISPVRKTSLVRIGALTSDPQLSARIANTHAEQFINLTKEERRQSTLDNLVFLKGQAAELADKVALAERAVAKYAEENAIVSLNKDENITVKQMGELSELLTQATAERVKAESAFKEASSGSGLSSTLIDDPSIEQLRLRLKAAEAEYAKLGRKFKPTYPQMQELAAEISDLKGSLNQQRKEAIGALEAKYKTAKQTEEQLLEKLEIQKSKAFELSRRQVQYNILNREYESLKDLHQSVLRELKEAQLSAENTGSNIALAERAAVPVDRDSPRIGFNLLLGLFLGAFAGIATAFLLESLDNTIKTPEEAERILGVPTLGIVPMFSADVSSTGPDKLLDAPADVPAVLTQDCVTHSSPRSIASEAFKAIRTSILFSSADNPPKCILFTSGQKSEGKTTLVVNLGISLAQSGHKVLLLDADLRRPAVHQRFKIAEMSDGGVVEYLTGVSPEPNVFRNTGVEGLEILYAGAIPPHPSELLGSRKMAELLHRYRGEYDYVLVDAPPVMPVTDAVLLSRSVDGVVVVVRGQHTQRQITRDSISKLRRVGAKILGIVLNDVDIRSGDYYYYRKGYDSYYREEDSPKRSFG